MISNLRFEFDHAQPTNQKERLVAAFDLHCPLRCGGTVTVDVVIASGNMYRGRSEMFHLHGLMETRIHSRGKEVFPRQPSCDRDCPECGVKFSATKKDQAEIDKRAKNFLIAEKRELF